jgi:hypothetical protein
MADLADPTPRMEALARMGLLERSEADAPLYREAARTPAHKLSPHRPVWRFCNPKFASDPNYFPDARPLFGFHSQDDGLDAVFAATKWAVFLGAENSPELAAALARPDVVCLVFEPSLARLAAFIAAFDLRKHAAKPFFFAGDHHRLAAPLMDALPKELASQGYPVFFVQEGLSADTRYQDELIEKIEFFYYRHGIYQYEGHWGRSGLPSRDIARGLFYDQQLHLYQNVVSYLSQGTVCDLENAFAGETALLVTGGPDLDAKIEYIRANRDKAVVICVNSALRTLVAAGVVPHLAVFNDTSIESSATLAGLPPLPETLLVAHVVTGVAPGAFKNVYFFGNVLPELFPLIPMLRLHGSVASTAFSLARHLGCARVVFVGLQMAGDDPFSMTYSRRSIQGEAYVETSLPLTDAYPQYYPVRAASGRTMYTTLNFYDAALWLLDELSRFDVLAVNTATDTIVHGPGVVVDPGYEIAARGDIAALAAAIKPNPQPVDRKAVHEYLLGQIEFWRLVKKMAVEDASYAEHPGFFELFASHLKAWDQANVSFLLERFPGFNIVGGVYADYFGSTDPEARRRAALHYLGGCADMAKGFIKLLGDQLGRFLALGRAR